MYDGLYVSILNLDIVWNSHVLVGGLNLTEMHLHNRHRSVSTLQLSRKVLKF